MCRKKLIVEMLIEEGEKWEGRQRGTGICERGGQGGWELVPPSLEAVRAYATIGEISDVLREIFGEYQAKDGIVRTQLRSEVIVVDYIAKENG
jgi:hypothetical protein